ncbi:MAG: hypothetical protein JO322_09845 [Candidatus Eremiobacteraeota bacterium]|nr:hypothetical protein [Candidatus Eremiobacteraeota bacterium]
MRPSRVMFSFVAVALVSACSSGGNGSLPSQSGPSDVTAITQGTAVGHEYQLTDLGTGVPGSPGLQVAGLNDEGQVVLNASRGQLSSLPSCGLPNQLPCGPPVALIYRNGALHVLPPLGKGQTADVSAINDQGVTGGFSASAVTQYAVVWKSDLSAVNFGTGITPPNSGAEVDALDNHGTVYGDSFNANVDIPIIFDSDNDGKPIAPCGSSVLGYYRSANNVGVGVGDELLSAGGTAVMTCPPFRVVVAPPNPNWLNFGFGINDRGDIAGRLSVGPTKKSFHPFLYHDGKVTDIGTPFFPGDKAANGAADGINDAGTVVGWMAAGGGIIGPPRVLPVDPRGFIYCGGRTIEVNTLLPASVAKDWDVIIAAYINNHGQIAGIAYKGGYPKGVEHAVLLTPMH